MLLLLLHVMSAGKIYTYTFTSSEMVNIFPHAPQETGGVTQASRPLCCHRQKTSRYWPIAEIDKPQAIRLNWDMFPPLTQKRQAYCHYMMTGFLLFIICSGCPTDIDKPHLFILRGWTQSFSWTSKTTVLLHFPKDPAATYSIDATSF